MSTFTGKAKHMNLKCNFRPWVAIGRSVDPQGSTKSRESPARRRGDPEYGNLEKGVRTILPVSLLREYSPLFLVEDCEGPAVIQASVMGQEEVPSRPHSASPTCSPDVAWNRGQGLLRTTLTQIRTKSMQHWKIGVWGGSREGVEQGPRWRAA